MKYGFVIDGGTTNTRVSCIDGDQNVLGYRKSDVGAGNTAVVGDNHLLCEAVRDDIASLMAQQGVTAADVSFCVAYGMITSAGGLWEVPHLCAPKTADDFRAGLVTRSFPDVAPFPITFIPGLKNFTGEVTLTNVAGMDMMRSEETESIGLWQLLQPQGPCVFVLPGSHNKFIRMDGDGRILGCMTSISGELLSALTYHTILAEAVDKRLLPAEEYDREWMLEGARACGEAGVGRAAFTARILRTLGKAPAGKIGSFLLGAVLNADAQALQSFCDPKQQPALYVAGKEPLRTALCDLCTALGYQATPVLPELTARMGLVGAMRIMGE